MRPARRQALAMLCGAACAAAAPQSLAATAFRRDRAGCVIADVTLNGRGPYRFVVDTGANRTVLAPHVATVLGLEPQTAPRRRLLGVGGEARAPTVSIDSMDIGVLHRRNVQALVMSRGMIGGADGLIGMDGLDGQRLALDFERRAIDLAPGGADAPLGFAAIPGGLRYGRLLTVPVVVRGVAATAIVDTGSQASIANDVLLRLARPAPAGARPHHVMGAGGQSRATTSYRFTQIDLGPLSISELIVDPGDLPPLYDAAGALLPTLCLGMDALGAARAIAIDLAKPELQVLADAQRQVWMPGPRAV